MEPRGRGPLAVSWVVAWEPCKWYPNCDVQPHRDEETPSIVHAAGRITDEHGIPHDADDAENDCRNAAALKMVAHPSRTQVTQCAERIAWYGQDLHYLI